MRVGAARSSCKGPIPRRRARHSDKLTSKRRPASRFLHPRACQEDLHLVSKANLVLSSLHGKANMGTQFSISSKAPSDLGAAEA